MWFRMPGPNRDQGSSPMVYDWCSGSSLRHSLQMMMMMMMMVVVVMMMMILYVFRQVASLLEVFTSESEAEFRFGHLKFVAAALSLKLSPFCFPSGSSCLISF